MFLKRVGFVVCAGVAALLFSSCYQEPLAPQVGGDAGGSVLFKLVAPSGSPFTQIAKTAKARVTAPGMDSIVQPLVVGGGAISGTVGNIPAGVNRKFEVLVYDSLSRMCYYGSTMSDIASGVLNNVAMSIYRTGSASINGTIVDSVNNTINLAPTVATSASASPVGAAMTSSLSVLGADDAGEGKLAYMWSTLGVVPAPVSFGPNGTNAAKNITATFSKTGTYLLQVTITDAGNLTVTSSVTVIVAGGSVDSFSTIEAESYTTMSGIQKEGCTEGGEDVGYWDAGDWIQFSSVNFGTGADSVQLRLAGSYSGQVELRLDSLSGPVIAAVVTPNTGNWQSWATVAAKVSAISGNHNLFVKCAAPGWNLNWIKFKAAGAARYTISYNGNGNTIGTIPVDANTYAPGASVTVAGNGTLVKTGSTFAGWNTLANGQGVSYAPGVTMVMGSANLILYAKWQTVQCTVTFDSQGGASVASVNVTAGTTISAIPQTTQSGCVFGGWFTSPNGVGTMLTSSTVISLTTTYYAYWLIQDIDGNIYKTVRIGNQVWMGENLRTTRYSDGSPIAKVSDPVQWQQWGVAAYCWYDNDSIANSKKLGALYNWFAVSTGKLNIPGWRIPDTTDWRIFGAYIANVGCAIMVDSGWTGLSCTPVDALHFSAYPSGYRTGQTPTTSPFINKGNAAYWWLPMQLDANIGECVKLSGTGLESPYRTTGMPFYKSCGMAVRLIRN